MTDVSATFGVFLPAWGGSPSGRLSERSFIKQRLSLPPDRPAPPRPENMDEESEMNVRANPRKILSGSRNFPNKHEATVAITDALVSHYGCGSGAAKRLARDAGCGIGTADNWLSGINAPTGTYLIRLMACCDAVFELVLTLADRQERLDAIKRDAALRKAADLLREVEA